MNILYSQKLQLFPIKHGFSTKTYSYSDQIFFPKQNHTNRVIVADQVASKEADAIITTQPHQKIGIKTADCVPILLFEKNKNIAAAVHAGWRGTATKIVVETVRKLRYLGGNAKSIVACIGPSIGECCYDVPKERLIYFHEDFIKHRNNRVYLNLKKANVSQLLFSGILKENIEIMPWCTSCHNDRFYSYRKQNKTEFQSNVSFIELN